MERTPTTAADAADNRRRLFALLEVAAAFALMHVAFRAFKRFTALGQREYESGFNVSPGLAFIVVACAAIWMRRRTLAAHGITMRGALGNANVGLVSCLVFAVVAAVSIVCGMRRAQVWNDAVLGAVTCALILFTSWLIVWVLARGATWIARLPRWAGAAFAIALPFLPIGVRLIEGRAVGPTALAVLWIVFGAAVGESVFFHGYVQSRLNEVFGRPWRVQGVAFGPSLFITAALFGLVHVLNTYDYFLGEGSLTWWWGAGTACALYFGLLREKTGSIVAPVILHAFIDLASLAVGLIAEP